MQTGTHPSPESTADLEEIEVSIIMPCRNEGGAIGDCVRQAFRVMSGKGYRGEVIVVDNDSSDDSADIARDAGAIVVRQPIRGYGAACIRGMERARGRILLIVDGDGTYDVGVLHRFVEPLRAGYDMVLGTRRNGEIAPGAMLLRHRHFWEPLQTQLARRFLPFAVSDVRCGMRSITREALDRLHLGSTGMEFSSEMLLEAAQANLSVVEVPVSLKRRPLKPRRTSRDSWRVTRFLLLLSPTRLFVVPGTLMLLFGLGLELALLPGPIYFGRFNLDFHFMFVGSAAAILGLQLVLLGIYAKTYALVHHEGPADPWAVRFNLVYTLEHGLLAGGFLFLAGLIINAWIVGAWISGGAGVIFAVRPAILALTLMVLGAEIIFASFFLTLLRHGEFVRP